MVFCVLATLRKYEGSSQSDYPTRVPSTPSFISRYWNVQTLARISFCVCAFCITPSCVVSRQLHPMKAPIRMNLKMHSQLQFICKCICSRHTCVDVFSYFVICLFDLHLPVAGQWPGCPMISMLIAQLRSTGVCTAIFRRPIGRRIGQSGLLKSCRLGRISFLAVPHV